jgi:3-oxoadipate enol-lactonase
VSAQTIDIADGSLAYHREPPAAPGGHDPVVLLHPWFGCWQFWRDTVAGLPEFETYAVDLYSLGANAVWQTFASPEGLSRAVGDMLDGLGIDRCSLAGNSMGGIAAQHLAATMPSRIGKLILVGTGARTVGVKPAFRASLDTWIAGGENRPLTEHLVDALLARRPADPVVFAEYVDMVARANKRFMGTVLENAFALDLRPRLPAIEAATLVVRGALDNARTRVHVDELLAGIRGSAAVEIADGGHSPQVDSPDAFVRVVRRFLLGEGRDGSPTDTA